MLWLLKKLIYGKFCEHHWTIHEEHLTEVYSTFSTDDMPSSLIKLIIQRCEKCGVMVSHKIKISS